MVLGVKAKNRNPKVQIDYLVHVQEIKPWPPSQSLLSLRSVLIQWENGDGISGSTSSVVPTLGSIVGEGKIEFKESFRLSVTLLRDMSVRGGDGYTFKKNCLEFNLFVPRRDKTVKGQLLASAIIDLAEYGATKETLSISIPMNCKRSYKNTDQPLLHIKLQPVEKGSTSSSSRGSLSRETSLDNEGGESVLALMDEEYVEEAEIASFTDDDGSSHSSVTASPVKPNGGLTTRNDKCYSKLQKEKAAPGTEGNTALSTKLHIEKSNLDIKNIASENVKGTSCSSSIDLSSDLGSPVFGHASASHSPNSSSTNLLEEVKSYGDHSSSPSLLSRIGNAEEEESYACSQGALPDKNHHKIGKLSSNSDSLVNNGNNDEKVEKVGRNFLVYLDEKMHSEEDGTYIIQDATMQQVSSESDTSCLSKECLGLKDSIVRSDRAKPIKSVRADLTKNGLVNNQHLDIKEIGIQDDVQRGTVNLGSSGRNAKIYPRDTKTLILESKIQQLEHRVKMLEGELREAAAVEAALYSVVAEHGSSMSKVHTPARRLSRFYLHAWRGSSRSRIASAARSAVSGLVLVTKACGNDVPRLIYWLSNSILVRTIISQDCCTEELPLSVGLSIKRNGSRKVKNDVSSSLKWRTSSLDKREGFELFYGSFGDWEEPHSFICALEKIEAWIFSRIVESIWWQTLTPYMQSVAGNAVNKDTDTESKQSNRGTCSSNDQEQVNFSLDLWKKAFKDARERLCPLRAEGHSCGCLPVLARLVMEQCVARLDVAMFNAILRESGDEIPTDPVSDPISDSNVLPIPSGKSSFRAGALLKNAIGNWSRWLTDLFDIDDDDSPEDANEHDDYDERQDTSCKSFHLLNALSDLMLLPKDLLLSKSVRKEVCPTFGVPLIKRVLDKFVPDEFCPDPIPGVVFGALDSEDSSLEAGEEALTNFPCSASSISYSPPSTASIASIIGDIGSQPHLKRSGSSLLRKSYTSDDELDELGSPLSMILNDGTNSPSQPAGSSWVSKENGSLTAIRYELLRDIWTDRGS